jgi:aerobic C4-dicarboxylate transport protein
MSEARALTNLVGNGVATIVIAKTEGALDEARMQAELDCRLYPPPEEAAIAS